MPPPHVGMITGSGAELRGTMGRGVGVGVGDSVGHRDSEYPEAIAWGSSAEAPSWPGHAN